MAESYNFQLLTGIVKVIRPKNKAVLGIADGQGRFMWLPTDKIIISHPQQFENWQTTIFAIDPTWKLNWKNEQKWDEYKASYPKNTKPILQPIPQMFQGATAQAPYQQTPSAPQQQQQMRQPMAVPIPVQQTQTVPMRQFQLPTHPQQQVRPTQTTESTTDTMMRIARALEGIERLLKEIIRPTKFKTADDIVMTNEDVMEQYGEPPSIDTSVGNGVKVNKDELPTIF